MPTGLTMSIEISGDKEMYARVADAMRKPREFMEAVGVYAMSRAVERLETVLRQDADAIRTGRLAASLTVGGGRFGSNPDTVWNLSDTTIECGTNLVYAAQVQYGGDIFPVNAKALAIPLTPKLKRAGLWPSELDPNRDVLQFVPIQGGNVIGLLIDEEGETAYGPGPLYALARWVTQEARPYLYFDAEDVRVINEELWPAHLGL